MEKESFIVGAFFGLAMAVFFSFSMGVIVGLISGAMSGVLFGGAIYLFSNSSFVKKQVSLDSSDLLPNESIILSSSANLIIQPKEFGLGKFAFDDLLWTVGMKDKESLGGLLHLTNLRLIFKSHKYNRVRGKTSIFLPSVRDLKNSSFFVFKKLTVSTTSVQVDFVVSEVNDFINKIRATQDQVTPESMEMIRDVISNDPSKLGDGLESWDAINTINSLINSGKKTSEAAKLLTNPIGALTSIFMNEIVDKVLAEEWQKVFEVKGHNKANSADPKSARRTHS